jgi:hypothetical protein
MPISATMVGVQQRTSVDSAACTGPEVRRARRRRAVTGVAGLSTQGPRWTTVPCPSGRESRSSSRDPDRHVHGGCARTSERLHVGASTAGRAPCLRPTSTAARRWHTVRTRSRDERGSRHVSNERPGIIEARSADERDQPHRQFDHDYREAQHSHQEDHEGRKTRRGSGGGSRRWLDSTCHDAGPASPPPAAAIQALPTWVMPAPKSHRRCIAPFVDQANLFC